MSDTTTKMRHWSYQRQCLGRRGTDPLQVLRNVIGVYSAHPTAPLSFFARVREFKDSDFYLLDENRLVLRIPAMRLSVYMVPKETAPLVFAATVPPASDPVWQKRYSQKGRNIPVNEYGNWQRRILDLAVQPLTAKAIKQNSGIPAEKAKLVLNRMAYEGSLLRVGAQSLRSNIISYVSAETWVGDSLSGKDRDEALTWLAGAYLKSFGPARVKDFQWWTGVNISRAKKAVAEQATVDIGDDYLLLTGDMDEFESFKFLPGDRVDLLPQWDCYTMGYAPDGRERFVSQDMQEELYGSLGATGGNALGAVLINGLAHGVWNYRFKGTSMQVRFNMFEKVSPQIRNEIEKQVNEVAAFFKAKKLEIENDW
jgi:hypothetical protein